MLCNFALLGYAMELLPSRISLDARVLQLDYVERAARLLKWRGNRQNEPAARSTSTVSAKLVLDGEKGSPNQILLYFLISNPAIIPALVAFELWRMSHREALEPVPHL